MYFDSFEIEHISQDVLNKIKKKSFTKSTVRKKSEDSIMCEFYCATFVEYMVGGQTLLDSTDLFSLNDYRKNGNIIHKYFKDKNGKKT